MAIVEISESHEECLFSQISFLVDSGYKVSLFIHPKIKAQISSYEALLSKVSVYHFEDTSFFKKLLLEFKLIRKLKCFDKVIFNTTSSSSIRNIIFFLNFYTVECIEIIHNVIKLNKSFTQKVISLKIKKYFALSDFLAEKTILKREHLKLSSFYPIFFPTKPIKIEKRLNEIWICIPGRVHFDRRNYQYLIDKLKKSTIPKHIKFVILGNINTTYGLIFKEELKKHKIEENFIIFENFIPNATYYNYVYSSNFMMPLLLTDREDYITKKITGSFNLAFAFKKPLLCNEHYKCLPDLVENSIFYTNDNFEQTLNSLKIDTVIKKSYSNPKWDYNFQKQKYIKFIEL